MTTHLQLFTPLIEMQDSLYSAQVTAEYSGTAGHRGMAAEAKLWAERSAWHLANAIGWASRS